MCSDGGGFESGDVFASGNIYGAAYQASQSTPYSKDQVGAATAAVLIAYDPTRTQLGATGHLVDRKTLITTVSYKDAEAPGRTQVDDARRQVRAEPVLSGRSRPGDRSH